MLEDDNLPKQVCYPCEFNILSTFSFQQQCQKSDSMLRALKTESTQEQIVELKTLVKNPEQTLLITEQFNENDLSHATLNVTLSCKANETSDGDTFIINSQYLSNCSDAAETCDSECSFTLDRDETQQYVDYKTGK